MDHFNYQNGELYAENLPLAEIAKEVGTPFYCYSTATLERHFNVFSKAFDGANALVCYAVKANSNLAVIKTLAKLGAGADVVSEGELRRALEAGIPANKIVFSGVGKKPHEMELALNAGILQFNVESEPEVRVLSEVATRLGKVAPIAFRVNPDVDAKTHAKISTGKAENKFGVPWQDVSRIYGEAATLPGIKIQGVDVHIGSQLTDLDPFNNAFMRVRELVDQLRKEGHEITQVDLGGGLGIPYDGTIPPAPENYGQVALQAMGNLGVQLIFEPGRLIVGNAGVLVSEVIYVKQGAERKFVILDAAMNDLIRPAMYDGYHHIDTIRQPNEADGTEMVDVVGPVCETGDTFAKGRELPPVSAGDLVAFRSAGAYGAVMASTYNTRPLVPEVLVNGDDFAVIRERPALEELLKQDKLPEWL
ncbi:diaminopimelate decarboxylase [Sneathiella sp. P13V-1]|uniref:diaminopimelate decarboxylase n=1 Tax=Sneathiella sp. P13V-1 TaxID=2697366 RepID=UPI00187B212A|nr:diaminopimelate decarboxylase [Sneathiella sp. P13V-1]MBE7635707.1 diaminopimelate decarboxylase [Sneathiella sp. P13V-1]